MKIWAYIENMQENYTRYLNSHISKVWKVQIANIFHKRRVDPQKVVKMVFFINDTEVEG